MSKKIKVSKVGQSDVYVPTYDPSGAMTFKMMTVGQTGTSAIQLDVGGNQNPPAISGSVQTGIMRIRATDGGLTALDFGVLSGGGAWLQASNQGALETTYKLCINPNGGLVGIGTLSPSVVLDVIGAIKASTTLTASAATNQLVLGTTTTATISSSTSGTSKTYTIPTDTPTSEFVMGAGNQTIGGTKTFSTAIASDISKAGVVDITSTGAGVTIGIHSTAGDDFNVGAGKLVVEGDTGNVGIGTAAPTMSPSSTPFTKVIQSKAAIRIGGDALLADGGDGLLHLASAGFVSSNCYNWETVIGQNIATKYTSLAVAYYTPITHTGVGYAGASFNGGNVLFYTYSGVTTAGATITPTERMRITSAGKVGIGVTPTYPIDLSYSNVGGGIAETALRLTNTSTINSSSVNFVTNRSWGIGVNGSGGAPAGGFYIQDYTAAATRLSITAGGAFAQYSGGNADGWITLAIGSNANGVYPTNYANSGVSISTNFSAGGVEANIMNNYTSGAGFHFHQRTGVATNTILAKLDATGLKVDHIDELTAAHGVSISSGLTVTGGAAASNTHANNFASSGLPTLSIGSTGSNRQLITVFLSAYYSNYNGTPLMARITFKIKDNITVLDTYEYSWYVPTGYNGILSTSYSAILPKASSGYTIAITDTEVDGGGHNWYYISTSANSSAMQLG